MTTCLIATQSLSRRLHTIHREGRILCESDGGRTWIGAVIEHGQTVSAVALRKMAESLYPVYSSQAGSIKG